MVKIPFDSGGEFVPAPEGRHRAVCVDVVDLGMQETPWGDKHKLRITWEIDKTMPPDDKMNERPFIVTNRYTASMNPKSNLYRDIVNWRGKSFSDDEMGEDFETESLIGESCWLQIIHEKGTYQGNETTYANISNIFALADGEEPLAPSGGFVRVKDREGYEGPDSAPAVGEYGTREDSVGTPPEDDDIPF